MILALLACNPTGTWTVEVEPLAESVRTTDDDCTITLSSFDTIVGNPSLGAGLPDFGAWAFDLTQPGPHVTSDLVGAADAHNSFSVWNLSYGALDGSTASDDETLLTEHITARAVGELECEDRVVAFDLRLHHDIESTCTGAVDLDRNGTAAVTVGIDAWMLWADTIGGDALIASDWVEADSDFNGELSDDELEFTGLDLRDPGSTAALNVLEYTQEQPGSWLVCP